MKRFSILSCALLGALACQPTEEPPPPTTRMPLLTLEMVAEGFTHPLALVEAPDDSGRLFVVDQVGTIWVIEADGTTLEQPFLDISTQLVELDPDYDERGLLGLAFHPDYADNGRFYVFYSAPLREQAIDNFDHTNVLAEYRVMGSDSNRADPQSEQRLLEIDHPYGNHNAGMLAFGPDGMLYLALGDGGNRDDQDEELVPGHVEDWYAVNGGGNGQDIEDNLLGSILRLDVSTPGSYSIPADNPFVDAPGVQREIHAYGFRNPYRFTIDPGGTHQLIVGDVGQDMFEEISNVTKGGNYGWNVYEGNHCFNAAEPTRPFGSCPTTVGASHPAAGDPLIAPVIELQNSGHFDEDGDGLAVVGGVVNRGQALTSDLDGRYLFGMWSTGEYETAEGEEHLPGNLLVATMRERGNWAWEPARLVGSSDGMLDALLLGFGQDEDGDVYVLTSDEAGPTGTSGKVRRLVAVPMQ